MKRRTALGILVTILAVFTVSPTLLTGSGAQSGGPIASFSFTPNTPYANGTVMFNASGSTSSDPNGIIFYRWNFGDNTPTQHLVDPNVTHIYTHAGNYTVTLNVTDNRFLTNSTTKPVTVHVGILELTVQTDDLIYYMDMNIIPLTGTFTIDNTPVPDGLVALEVSNELDQPVLLKTVQIGTLPHRPLPIEIIAAYLCDFEGTPKSVGRREPFTEYFNVSFKNVGAEVVNNLVVTVCMISDLYAFYTTLSVLPQLSPGYSAWWLQPFQIPSWVTTENATIFVNVWSGVPSLGGHPYAFERTSTFAIQGGSAYLGRELTSTANGSFTLNLVVPVNAGDEHFYQGRYHVYTSASFLSYTASNGTMFYARLAGDCDGDSDVDSIDVFSHMALAYSCTTEDPCYRSNCDFDYDGDVDSTDVFSYVALYYGDTAT